MHRVVVGDLVETLAAESVLAGSPEPADDVGWAFADARDLDLPLVLQRGWTHDQYPLDPKMTGHDFYGRYRLDRFAEPHFVADDAPARAAGKQRGFPLVVVEGHAEEVLETGAPNASWESFRDDHLTALGVSNSGDEIESVLVTAKLGIEEGGLRKERLEMRKPVWGECSFSAEVAGRQASQLGRRAVARPEPYNATGAVLHIDLAVGRF